MSRRLNRRHLDKTQSQEKKTVDKIDLNNKNKSNLEKPACKQNDSALSEHSSDIKNKRQDNPKHWLDYTTSIFVALAFVATAAAAAAAFCQAFVASDQEKRQLRAYVGPSFGSIKFNGKYADFNIKNFGVTPAMHINVCAEILIIRNVEEPITKRNKLFADCDGQQAKLINPTIWPLEGRQTSAILVNPSEMNLVMSDAARAFLIGKIEYTDIFEKQHHTIMCRVFVPPSHRFGSESDIVDGPNHITLSISGCDASDQQYKDD